MKYTTIHFYSTLPFFIIFLILSHCVCSLLFPHYGFASKYSLNGRRVVLPRSSFTRGPTIKGQHYFSTVPLVLKSSLHNHDETNQNTNHHPELFVKGVTLKMAFDKTYSVADDSELKSERFTCPQSLDLVHKLRRNSDCVLVGRETVVRDDCTLTVRRVDLLKGRRNQQPVRVVIDSKLKLLERNKKCGTGETNKDDEEYLYPTLLRDGYRTIIYHACENGSDLLEGMNDSVTLVKISTRDEENDILSPSLILKDLESKHIFHVMVEGGPATAIQFLKEKVVDRAIFIRAPVKFIQPVPSGMSDGMLEEAGLVLLETRECGDDVVEYWVRKGESWPTERVEDWPI